MFWRAKTTTLYRVVGQREMDLIRAADHRAFPPRTRAQPLFIAVPDADYATEIAREWNTKDAPLGTPRHVTRFVVSADLLRRHARLKVPAIARFERVPSQVDLLRGGGVVYQGARMKSECWVPSAAMGDLNSGMRGTIEEIAEFPASPVWCPVANVAETRPYGEGGEETRRGTKHFPSGAKVYCVPALWGDGYESIKVVGRHRGSHRYVTMIVESRWLTNWRTDLVYSPHVIVELAPYWDGTTRSKDLAHSIVQSKDASGLREASNDP